MEIPALPCSRNGTDSYLCPFRALVIYMKRTRSFRRNRKRLFISYVKAYDKEINASTISRWIVDTVRFAYDQSGSSSASKICAHELRALILKAARKSASENVVCLCRLLHLLANFSNLHFAYRQKVWTQIRLLLKEQSDLGPHCLQQ